MDYVKFFAAATLLYLALWFLVLLLNFLFKLRSRAPQALSSLSWPLHFFLVTLSLSVSQGLYSPGEGVWITYLGPALGVALVWFGVRLFSVLLFGVYLGRIKGIAAPGVLAQATNTLLYAFSFLTYLHIKFEYAVGDLVITTAVVVTVIAIAFQTPISTLINGISASLEDHFRIGDTIQLGEFKGDVIESNWRFLVLKTPEGNSVTIPIRKIAEMPLVNFNRPDKTVRHSLRLKLSGAIAPGVARKQIEAVALDVEGVLAEPPPLLLHAGFDGATVLYDLSFSVASHKEWNKVSDAVYSVVWYRLRRLGLRLPFSTDPEPDIAIVPKPPVEKESIIGSVLAKVPLFAELAPATIELLAKQAMLERFGKGERLFRQGDAGDSLYIVWAGSVDVYIKTQGGPDKQVATLGTDSILGEISLLTGEPRSATAILGEESSLVCINKAAFQDVIIADPGMAVTLTNIMTKRQEENARRAGQEMNSQQIADSRDSMLSRIKSFFSI